MLKLRAAGLLIAATLSTQAPASRAAAAEIGRIKTVTGQAAIVRGGATLPAAPGATLTVRDVLTTGKDGRIGITFIDNSRFAIGPNAHVALAEFEFDDTTHKGSSLTQVDRGSLAIVSGQIAKENKDAMKVKTPTSLLAARGTRFVVDVP
ncbi:MAG: FecR domain-containing protein [Proteobacteria bacterium]|nr:FecR domain-containing protein [Pseudomonadota bacterium]